MAFSSSSRAVSVTPTAWASRLAPLAFALACAACTGGAAEDEGDGTDEGTLPPQACADPGSPLLDSAKPAGEPDGTFDFTCTGGWGSDAPTRDATWTVELPWLGSDFGFSGTSLQAHPGGGVVLAHDGLFARLDPDGALLWNKPTAIPIEARAVMAVEPAGTILVAVYDWNSSASTVDRYDADGNLLEAVSLPFNDANGGEVWALVPSAGELLVGAYDSDQFGSYETTLLRLDGAGNLLLRKSTSTTNDGLLAANADTIVFGRFPTFLLTRDNGSVLGNLTPSSGQPLNVAGYGSDFVAGTTANGDFSVGRYSSAGVEQWLRSYDRANVGGDAVRAIAADADGGIVAAGAIGSLTFNGWWFNNQPQVFALDADGNAVWADRIDAIGEANGVVFSDGAVYVTGVAEGESSGGNQPPLLRWLRRYDP